ncbi:MAG: peptide-binding protein [Thermoproteales archaeon]|nr:peptide-binding protein [Thermoproteales archaeon]
MERIYKRLSIILLLLILTLSICAITSSVTAAPEKGPATDTLVFKRVPLDIAGEALKAGEIDYYIYNLRPAHAIALKEVPEITLYYAPSGIVNYDINPAPAPEGELNPFSIREVRFALNYLIDRDYVVNEIYKGFAAPMYTFLSSYDPDFVTIYDIVAKYEFKYDPAKADAIITEALTKAGAVKEAGKWYYNGKPITIKFVIRIEDERRELGDALASELEKLGFAVERMYMPFGQAIPIVYGTDPKELQWHIYTAGWGKGALDKWDYSTINQFGCPWYGWLPGYQEAGWWQYENATLDELGIKIFKGEFKSKAERNELYRKATEMIIQESVRVWIATQLAINPARKEVKGLTNDLGAGLRSPLNPREVYVPGKDTVVVGHNWVWTEATVWNPIGGHDDVYSVDIWRAIYDPAMWRHPFSGEPIPFRLDYAVETAGPDDKLNVPPDAFMWDAEAKAWKAVGEGVTATSKVTFDLSKYIGTKWHNGQEITWEDVLFSIYQTYDIMNDPEKSSMEAKIAAILKETLAPIKGYRIVGENKLEVYLDYWHFDPNYIAEYAAPPLQHYPWELLAAMDKVVFEKKQAAYSETASEKFGVPWLSMILKDHAAMIDSALDEIEYPENVFTVLGTFYGKKENFESRKAADHAWFSEHGHLVISDGPFYLNKFDPAAQYAELKAWRDETYPFTKGKWYFGIPTPPEIVSVGLPTVVPGGDARIIVEVRGPPPLGVKYLIKDPATGKILMIGEAEKVTPTSFVIELSADFTAKLKPGLYELTVAGYSESVAFVSSEKRYFGVLNIKPLESAFEKVGKSLEDKIGTLSGQVGALSGQIESVNNNIKTLSDDMSATTNSLNTLLMVLIVLVIVNIVVSVLALVKKK